MSVTEMECDDFTLFQDALKAMRKTDDIIISTINTVVPTDSFHTDAVAGCKSLHESLDDGNVKREKFIKNCIGITKERVRKLKEERNANLDDIKLSKDLRSEQTKLRMLQVELSVEDLIKQRTGKVFNERCGRYYKAL